MRREWEEHGDLPRKALATGGVKRDTSGGCSLPESGGRSGPADYSSHRHEATYFLLRIRLPGLSCSDQRDGPEHIRSHSLTAAQYVFGCVAARCEAHRPLADSSVAKRTREHLLVISPEGIMLLRMAPCRSGESGSTGGEAVHGLDRRLVVHAAHDPWSGAAR